MKSRRSFLGNIALTAAANVFLPARSFLGDRGWLQAAQAPPPDVLHDTVNGLFAFIVPGFDQYSVAQEMSTTEPGGVDAGAVDVFVRTLDASTPFVPSFSGVVTATLNGLAQTVNPAAGGGPFASPFARLSYAEKAAVFQIMDATDQLRLLGGLLPLFVAFFTYSEARVLDPATLALTGRPGWPICGGQGASDSPAELVGYVRQRKEA
jgi:hypothetical protein